MSKTEVIRASKDGFDATPAIQPTLYFIGVTTGKSSIIRVFPAWAEAFGLDNVVIKGIDIAIHEDPSVYHAVVDFIKHDPLSYGALVTTHKLDLYAACRDMFEYLDPYAEQLNELSCISKLDGKLCGHAKDPITCGMALVDFVPVNWWSEHSGDFYVLGAGGSAISMGAFLMRQEFSGNYPKRIIVSNRSKPRLEKIESIFSRLNPGGIAFEYHYCPEPVMNDAVLKNVRPYSVIVNATGLGKDRPGSPITNDAVFPKKSLVWEINYRGELDFMQQALAQKESQNLWVEDGWRYFIYGWALVISEVFHVAITAELLERLDGIAKSYR